jgi:hypothetical protein
MYRGNFYTGDTRDWQKEANADRCAAYGEHLRISSGIAEVSGGEADNHPQPA